MYLYFFLLLLTLTKRNYTLNIKKRFHVLNYLHFSNSKASIKNVTSTYFTNKNSSRHEIYRKRFERELKETLQSILYKKGIKINYKYHIDEDIIEGIAIHQVQLNSDCSVAKVFIEIMGDSIDSRQGYIWMKKNCKRIRYMLAQAIKHRKRVPFLNFVLSNLSEQTQLLCQIENIREYYGEMFKEDLGEFESNGEEADGGANWEEKGNTQYPQNEELGDEQ
ncbi:hypothetical protein PCYB_081260 [Plasmodium cynomolgi strain B]|uniref:Ribosome-binding factor A n=1 Tax=Plasmodium cynomolgi (strain B) TaxID=1120755 RepID=K6UUS4_PLACD|nr:hypothetical protein PCYB_081260 [Plasmodium cynomolgi strain B]GAB65965.1 hypothetical protein PCYB_081260 [Plasmodium cynomolgi strain B]